MTIKTVTRTVITYTCDRCFYHSEDSNEFFVGWNEDIQKVETEYTNYSSVVKFKFECENQYSGNTPEKDGVLCKDCAKKVLQRFVDEL